MHVKRPITRVELNQHILDLADTQHGALYDLLDVQALLRMYHLIVTVFKLAVDIDVLDVEAGQVLENLVFAPGFLDVGPVGVRV